MSIDDTYITSNFDEDIAKQIKKTYEAIYNMLIGVWVNWYKDISRKMSGVNNFYIGENQNDRGYIGRGSNDLNELKHFFDRTFHTNIYNLLSKSSNNFNRNDNVNVGGGGANQLDQAWRNILQSIRAILYNTAAGDSTILENYNNNAANSKLNDDIVLFFYLFIGIRSCGSTAVPVFYRDNENHIYDNIINNQLNNIIIKIKRNEILIDGEMNSILNNPAGRPGLDPQSGVNTDKTYIYNILKYIPKLIWIANNQINYIEEIEKLLQENMEVNAAGGDIRSPDIKQQIIDISKIIIIAYKNKRVIYNKDNIGKDISSDSSFMIRNITDDLNMFIADGIKDTKKIDKIIKGVNMQNTNHSEYNVNDCPSNQYRNEQHYFNTSTYGTYRNGNQFPQNQCNDMIKDYYTYINDKIKEEIGTNSLEENNIKEQMLKYINSSDLYIYDKEHLQANMYYVHNGFYPIPKPGETCNNPASFAYLQSKIIPLNDGNILNVYNHSFNNITIINIRQPAGGGAVNEHEYHIYESIVNLPAGAGHINRLHEKNGKPDHPPYPRRILSDNLKLFMVGKEPERTMPKCGTLDEKYLFEKFNYGIEIPNNLNNCNMTPESLFHKYHPHLHNLKHVFFNHWLLDKIFGLEKEGKEEKEILMAMMLKEDSRNKQRGGSINMPSGPSGSFNFNIKKKVYDEYNKKCLTFLFLFINKLMRIDRYVYDEENFENEYLHNDCIKETIYLIFFNAILNRYKSEFEDEEYDLDKATINTENGINVYPNADLRKDETPKTIINHKFIILNKLIRNLIGCKDSVKFNNLLFHYLNFEKNKFIVEDNGFDTSTLICNYNYISYLFANIPRTPQILRDHVTIKVPNILLNLINDNTFKGWTLIYNQQYNSWFKYSIKNEDQIFDPPSETFPLQLKLSNYLSANFDKMTNISTFTHFAVCANFLEQYSDQIIQPEDSKELANTLYQFKTKDQLLQKLENKNLYHYEYIPHVDIQSEVELPNNYKFIQINKKLIDLFLNKNININIPDRFGKTPLHYALTYLGSDIIKKLIYHKHSYIFNNYNNDSSPFEFFIDLFLNYCKVIDNQQNNTNNDVIYDVELDEISTNFREQHNKNNQCHYRSLWVQLLYTMKSKNKNKTLQIYEHIFEEFIRNINRQIIYSYWTIFYKRKSVNYKKNIDNPENKYNLNILDSIYEKK